MDVRVARLQIPYSELQALPKDERSAFLRVGWFFSEANWLRKLLMIAVAQDLGPTETPATLWLRALLLTTLCGKMYEGWKIISSDKNYIGQTIAQLLRSNENFKEKQERLKTRLQKRSFVGKIRHNIGFHYQFDDFDRWPPHAQDGDPLLSVLLTPFDGDMLPALSVVPLFETVARLHRKTIARLPGSFGSPEPTTREEWEKSHLAALGEISKTSHCYCSYLQAIFLTMLRKKVHDRPEGFRSYEIVENPPRYNAQRIYFFMVPPTEEELAQFKKDIDPTEA